MKLIICTLGNNKADIEFSTKMSTTNKKCTGSLINKCTGQENETQGNLCLYEYTKGVSALLNVLANKKYIHLC